ncbi:odorant receptor 43a isoform X1 [Solenopsis invicta]|uniref:odorant receptor 43a isoform X1 n=1 Tax=Solenopsis invicta TaxID=13686 RepID=UPI00193EAF71|nr:odorant receptor 43a isoform X1 [Solenopsis invicta]
MLVNNNKDISMSSGYSDFVWAVKLHYFGLEILGLWPKIDKCARLWSRIRVGFILTLLIFISDIPLIFAIVQTWSNMVSLINTLQLALPFMVVSVKYFIIQWKRTVFLSIVNMMAEDWMAIKLDTERNVMIKQARIARSIMIIGYIFVALACLSLILPSYFGIEVIDTMNLTNRNKPLPLQTYHYDTDKSPQFELTLLIHTLTILFAGIIYLCLDNSLILITFHIRGQLENFRCRLVRLVCCKNFNKVLNNIIITHLRLIRFANNIENIYSLIILISILNFSVVFCLCGFLITIVSFNKKNIKSILMVHILFRFLITYKLQIFNDRKINETALAQVYLSTTILLCLLINTFLYCGAGQLIIEQCNKVHYAVCDLEWYKLEARKARNIILLMMQTSHPFCMTAGNIIPLTMATFVNVLKSSFGYISLLLTKHS